MNDPERRIGKSHSLNQNIFTLQRLQKQRAQLMTFSKNALFNRSTIFDHCKKRRQIMFIFLLWLSLFMPIARGTTPRPPIQDSVFNINEYGAVADGTIINTEAFKAAIAACNQAGGGKVLVPEGTYLTGSQFSIFNGVAAFLMLTFFKLIPVTGFSSLP